MKRIDIRSLLADPARRRELMARVIVAIQAREGIDTTMAQALAAYDKEHVPCHPSGRTTWPCSS